VCVCEILDYRKGICLLEPNREVFFYERECIFFLEFELYYTLDVFSPFSDSTDTIDIRREGKNGEMLVNMRSISLSVPSSIEEHGMMKNNRSMYVLGLELRRCEIYI
jgi:hypothetical protein